MKICTDLGYFFIFERKNNIINSNFKIKITINYIVLNHRWESAYWFSFSHADSCKTFYHTPSIIISDFSRVLTETRILRLTSLMLAVWGLISGDGYFDLHG